MAIRLIQCPTCSAQYQTEAYASNRRFKCPNCNCKFMIPGDDLNDPLIGQEIGGCKIIAKIGEGGMGRIYKATHEALKKRVAIKILPEQFSTNQRYVTRFVREARSAARVEHPNIVSVLNVGEDQGHHYIVMQYIEGTDLDTIVKKRGRLMPDEALRIIEQATDGLAEIERTSLVHRDIKPSNLLVTSKGHVYITDFGLARGAADTDEMAHTGKVVGTPYFMSPEQCEGKLTDIRGDMYSLGATFYYLLTGRKPFEGETSKVVIYKHRFVDLIPPHTVYNDIPVSLSNIIVKMMAKKPEDRYQTVEQLLAELHNVEPEIHFDTAAAVARLGQMVPDSLSGSTTIIIHRDQGPNRALVIGLAAGLALTVLVLIVAVLLRDEVEKTVPLEFRGQWSQPIPPEPDYEPEFVFKDNNPGQRDLFVLYNNTRENNSLARLFSPGRQGPTGRLTGIPGRVFAAEHDISQSFYGLSLDGRRVHWLHYTGKPGTRRNPVMPLEGRKLGPPPYHVALSFFQDQATRQLFYAFELYNPNGQSWTTEVGLTNTTSGWKRSLTGVSHVHTYVETIGAKQKARILVVQNGEVRELDANRDGNSMAWSGGQVPRRLTPTAKSFIIEHVFIVKVGNIAGAPLRALYFTRRATGNSPTDITERHNGNVFIRSVVEHTQEHLFLATLSGEILPGWQNGVSINWGSLARPRVAWGDLDDDGNHEIVVNPGDEFPTTVLRERGVVAASAKHGLLVGLDEVTRTRKQVVFRRDGVLEVYALEPIPAE